MTGFKWFKPIDPHSFAPQVDPLYAFLEKQGFSQTLIPEEPMEGNIDSLEMIRKTLSFGKRYSSEMCFLRESVCDCKSFDLVRVHVVDFTSLE